ncbi:MAG: hypothetical protein JRL30_21775 [Deltaproteobacteria bacterium]|nr:hypothetical protein [Deltaproteobacteria bacterium]
MTNVLEKNMVMSRKKYIFQKNYLNRFNWVESNILNLFAKKKKHRATDVLVKGHAKADGCPGECSITQ